MEKKEQKANVRARLGVQNVISVKWRRKGKEKKTYELDSIINKG